MILISDISLKKLHFIKHFCQYTLCNFDIHFCKSLLYEYSIYDFGVYVYLCSGGRVSVFTIRLCWPEGEINTVNVTL